MSPRGRNPLPGAMRRGTCNPGKHGDNPSEPVPAEGLPHPGEVVREAWHRLARVLHDMGVITVVDRAALAA